MTTALQELDEVLAKIVAMDVIDDRPQAPKYLAAQNAAWDLILNHAPAIRAALELQARVDAGVLQAFEAKFWEAVQLSGSRDFDHDVCKEVRDFRAMLKVAPPAGGQDGT